MSPRTAAAEVETASTGAGPGTNPGSPNGGAPLDARSNSHYSPRIVNGAAQHSPPFNAAGTAGAGAPRRAPAPSLGNLPTPSLATLALASPHSTPGAASTTSGSPYAGFKDLHAAAGGTPPAISATPSLNSLGNANANANAASLSAQDARRRNAEQRAAVLRADPLLKEVEPSRVFCGLCGKWVQLRQDSSYCAYPWHQHRSKCLAR